MKTGVVIHYPCRICRQPLSSNSNSLECFKCDIWVHQKCNEINKQIYEYEDKSAWYLKYIRRNFFYFPNQTMEVWKINTYIKR